MFLATLLATALAQPVPGTWTGYVNGWSPTQQTPSSYLGGRGPLRLTAAQQQALALQLAAQQTYATQLVLAQRAQDIARQSALVSAEATLATSREEEIAREVRRLRSELEERSAREQLERVRVERERAELERERDDAARAEKQRVERDRLEQERMERERAERERIEQERTARAQQKSEPGPNIHQWVDAEGVTHLSTRPPP